MSNKLCGGLLIATLFSQPVFAVTIDNDVPSGTLGHWSVNVTTGGESRSAYITANRLASNDIFTEDLLYDYFSYVDTGSIGGGFRLQGSTPILDSSDSDKVTSSGSFLGEAGNTIQWQVKSSIPDNGGVMTSVLRFTAETGALGALRFYQYMDEDLEGVSDDVFFTRGSIATDNFELFTVDNREVYGVSHAGALSLQTGLINASFVGWAANRFDQIKPRITSSGQPVSLAGIIDNLPIFAHPQVGSAFGPRDIVSVLAWEVDPDATSAVIVTTLGGVPDVIDIPVADSNPPICSVENGAGMVEDNRPSEDLNNNGVLDPGEDINGNASIDVDTGIFSVDLVPGSTNLVLVINPFIPGDSIVSYSLVPDDPSLPAIGAIVATDGAGNTCEAEINLGTFDPFRGIIRTPTRDFRLLLLRPSPDTFGARCVENVPPGSTPDFNGVPFIPFPDDSVELDILLSEGSGEKEVCCQYIDNSDNISPAACSTITLDDQPAPDAPGDLSGRAKPGKSNLVWTVVATANSYDVFRSSTSDGPYDHIGSTEIGVFVDANATAGETFHYVVQSVNTAGNSENSNEFSVTVPTESARRR